MSKQANGKRNGKKTKRDEDEKWLLGLAKDHLAKLRRDGLEWTGQGCILLVGADYKAGSATVTSSADQECIEAAQLAATTFGDTVLGAANRGADLGGYL